MRDFIICFLKIQVDHIIRCLNIPICIKVIKEINRLVRPDLLHCYCVIWCIGLLYFPYATNLFYNSLVYYISRMPPICFTTPFLIYDHALMHMIGSLSSWSTLQFCICLRSQQPDDSITNLHNSTVQSYPHHTWAWCSVMGTVESLV